MREQGAKNNTPFVEIGVVVSADPLTIRVGELQVSKENILIAEYLMPEYTRKYSITGKMTVESSLTTDGTSIASYGPHSHDLDISEVDHSQEGDFKFTDGLKKDDLLALTPSLDNQTYILLAKVVRA